MYGVMLRNDVHEIRMPQSIGFDSVFITSLRPREKKDTELGQKVDQSRQTVRREFFLLS